MASICVVTASPIKIMLVQENGLGQLPMAYRANQVNSWV